MNIRDLQLDKTVGWEYVREVSSIRYGIENYMIIRLNIRSRIELLNIRRHQIVGLEEL